MNDEQRKRMLEKSGGDQAGGKAPKYSVPIIKFDGRTGAFSKISYEDSKNKTETPIESPIEFVILKKRKVLSHFGSTVSYFSNEFVSSTEKVQLFKKEGGAISLATTDFANKIREDNPLVKTHEIVYVLHDGEVCKLEIKGGSTQDYYAFQKNYSDEQKHSFELTTRVSFVKTKNAAGFSYVKMVFSFEDTKVDFDLIEKSIDEVNENLAKIDEYTKLRIAEKEGGKYDDVKKARDAEQKAADKQRKDVAGEDEINPEDIPF